MDGKSRGETGSHIVKNSNVVNGLDPMHKNYGVPIARRTKPTNHFYESSQPITLLSYWPIRSITRDIKIY